MITPGERYTHYKRGGEYEIVSVGIMQSNTSDDGKQVVVYTQLHEAEDYPAGTIWVRPVEMFLEEVEVDGEKTTRFKKLT